MQNVKKTPVKRINITLEEDYVDRLDEICSKEYTDRSKRIRKWIDSENPAVSGASSDEIEAE